MKREASDWLQYRGNQERGTQWSPLFCRDSLSFSRVFGARELKLAIPNTRRLSRQNRGIHLRLERAPRELLGGFLQRCKRGPPRLLLFGCTEAVASHSSFPSSFASNPAGISGIVIRVVGDPTGSNSTGLMSLSARNTARTRPLALWHVEAVALAPAPMRAPRRLARERAIAVRPSQSPDARVFTYVQMKCRCARCTVRHWVQSLFAARALVRSGPTRAAAALAIWTIRVPERRAFSDQWSFGCGERCGARVRCAQRPTHSERCVQTRRSLRVAHCVHRTRGQWSSWHLRETALSPSRLRHPIDHRPLFVRADESIEWTPLQLELAHIARSYKTHRSLEYCTWISRLKLLVQYTVHWLLVHIFTCGCTVQGVSGTLSELNTKIE